MTPATEVRVVPATEEHIPFVAWVVNTANRSHLPEGLWDKFIGKGEAESCGTWRFLSRPNRSTRGLTICSWSPKWTAFRLPASVASSRTSCQARR